MQEALDASTRLEIFSSYLRPFLLVPMLAIPLASKKAITAFCTLFICIIKMFMGVVRNIIIPKFLGALNVSHPIRLCPQTAKLEPCKAFHHRSLLSNHLWEHPSHGRRLSHYGKKPRTATPLLSIQYPLSLTNLFLGRPRDAQNPFQMVTKRMNNTGKIPPPMNSLIFSPCPW